MQCFTYQIRSPGGLHVRQAGMLARLEREFLSNIEISLGSVNVNANRPAVLLGLKIKPGDVLSVAVTGADEYAAADRLRMFFAENL